MSEYTFNEVQFNQELSFEDKYRSFDVNLLVSANVREEITIGYPTEVIVDILDVEVFDGRDVTPFKNGQSVLKDLNKDDIEFLKDQAVKEAI